MLNLEKYKKQRTYIINRRFNNLLCIFFAELNALTIECVCRIKKV